MIREEMIEILNEYCKSITDPMCQNCLVQKDDAIGEGCVEFVYRTDEELTECIKKIITSSVEKENDAHTCKNIADDDLHPVKYMVAISRDELCAMRGRLLMIASCSGVTITDAMADEMLSMAETIESALSDDEVDIG